MDINSSEQLLFLMLEFIFRINNLRNYGRVELKIIELLFIYRINSFALSLASIIMKVYEVLQLLWLKG